jgi:hypothetical protein
LRRHGMLQYDPEVLRQCLLLRIFGLLRGRLLRGLGKLALL